MQNLTFGILPIPCRQMHISITCRLQLHLWKEMSEPFVEVHPYLPDATPAELEAVQGSAWVFLDVASGLTSFSAIIYTENLSTWLQEDFPVLLHVVIESIF